MYPYFWVSCMNALIFFICNMITVAISWKPYILVEDLLQLSVIDVINMLISDVAGNLLSKSPSLNNTINCWMQWMEKDINVQLNERMKRKEFRLQQDALTSEGPICYRQLQKDWHQLLPYFYRLAASNKSDKVLS